MIAIPIDFHAIAKDSGLRKGKIFHSPRHGWVVGNMVDFMACINPPKYKGKMPIRIENNCWIYAEGEA